ncbi:MAG TPA: porin [Gemmataceae bacterium]|nr:porin [Gemmataceae bacterium]
MYKRLWRKFIRVLFVGGVVAVLLGGRGSARAEEPDTVPALKAQFELQKQQLEEQTKLLEELKKRVDDLKEKSGAATAAEPAPADLPPPPPPDKGTVEQIVGDYLHLRDAQKKAAEEAKKAADEHDGYKVGTNLGMSVHWNPLNGVTFETPNKDFTSHLGFWFQFDTVAFSQSGALKSPTQIGDLQDGAFFRRIRPQWEGTAWEVVEWDIILQLEATANDVPQIDEAWVGLTKLPILGSVRVGKTRIPQGLEAGSYTGFKAGTFMEQSSFGSAFYEDLAPGIWTSNSVLHQRMTWAAMFYRQDNVPGGSDSGQSGTSFADGKYAYAGRLTALPVYENDGRCLLHLGASYGWRKAEDVPAPSGTQGGTVGPTFIDFRSRPLLRDAIGDYGGTNGNNATSLGLPGDSKQLIDTGLLTASSSTVIGTELLWIRGAFSLQAEYGWASANDVYVPNPNPHGPKMLGLGDVWFRGYYVQLSYFLTGENRRYDTRYGRLSRTTTAPYTPFWLTRGEDDRLLLGRGAWELAARWNHLNLDNGLIQAGQTDAFEVGLNWYLSPTLRIQFEYLHQNRYDKSTGPNGTLPGDLDGLGLRTQWYF